MATLTTVQTYTDGEELEALVLNRPISQLNANQLAINAELEGITNGGMKYLGDWDASSNQPPSATPNIGDMFRISVVGTFDSKTFAVNDYTVWDGINWQQIEGTNLVRSVAGKTGDVTLVAADITDLGSYIGAITPNQISGLITSNNVTDADHDIDIAIGAASDSTNAFSINLTSALTKQIDAAWAEGTNLGGFPSGLTLTAATWYAVFVIAKADGTVDAGFDTSLTAANLLADATGYTYYRRIGWVLTDGTSNIRAFYQKGDRFIWNTIMSTDKDGNSNIDLDITTTEVQIDLAAAPNTTAEMTVFSIPTNAIGAFFVVITPTFIGPQTATASSFTTTSLNNGAGDQYGSTIHIQVDVDAASEVNAVSSSAGAGISTDIIVTGWIDDRGKQ